MADIKTAIESAEELTARQRSMKHKFRLEVHKRIASSLSELVKNNNVSAAAMLAASPKTPRRRVYRFDEGEGEEGAEGMMISRLARTRSQSTVGQGEASDDD